MMDVIFDDQRRHIFFDGNSRVLPAILDVIFGCCSDVFASINAVMSIPDRLKRAAEPSSEAAVRRVGYGSTMSTTNAQTRQLKLPE